MMARVKAVPKHIRKLKKKKGHSVKVKASTRSRAPFNLRLNAKLFLTRNLFYMSEEDQHKTTRNTFRGSIDKTVEALFLKKTQPKPRKSPKTKIIQKSADECVKKRSYIIIDNINILKWDSLIDEIQSVQVDVFLISRTSSQRVIVERNKKSETEPLEQCTKFEESTDENTSCSVNSLPRPVLRQSRPLQQSNLTNTSASTNSNIIKKESLCSVVDQLLVSNSDPYKELNTNFRSSSVSLKCNICGNIDSEARCSISCHSCEEIKSSTRENLPDERNADIIFEDGCCTHSYDDWNDLCDQVLSWRREARLDSYNCLRENCYKKFCGRLPCSDVSNVRETVPDEFLLQFCNQPPPYINSQRVSRPVIKNVFHQNEPKFFKSFKIVRPLRDDFSKLSESFEFPVFDCFMSDDKNCSTELVDLKMQLKLSYDSTEDCDMNSNPLPYIKVVTYNVVSNGEISLGTGHYNFMLTAGIPKTEMYTKKPLIFTVDEYRPLNPSPEFVFSAKISKSGPNHGFNNDLCAIAEKSKSDLPIEYRLIGVDVKNPAVKDAERRIFHKFGCFFCLDMKFKSLQQLVLHLSSTHVSLRFACFFKNAGCVIEIQKRHCYKLPSPLTKFKFLLRSHNKHVIRKFRKHCIDNALMLTDKAANELFQRESSKRELFFLNGFSSKSSHQQEFDADNSAKNSVWLPKFYERHFYESTIRKKVGVGNVRKLSGTEADFIIMWNIYCSQLGANVKAACHMPMMLRGFIASRGDEMALKGMLGKLIGLLELIRRHALITTVFFHDCLKEIAKLRVSGNNHKNDAGKTSNSAVKFQSNI